MALTVLHDPAAAVQWLRAGGARALCTDSRRVQAGDAFLAWRGVRDDGRRHVAAALAAGAACCLVDAQGVDSFAFDERRVACSAGLKASAGAIADTWYGHPSGQLDVVAVTGTNGKTSVAWWTAQALTALGRRCGVIGTLGVGEPPRAGEPGIPLQASGLTTPDAVMLQAALSDFVARGFAACTMEASSIGLVDDRLAGTRIAVAQFTNFTQDHLDYHGDMTAYWAAKRTLFGWSGLRAAVINVDDEQGAALVDELAAAGSPPALWTYSLLGDARLSARNVRYEGNGLAFDLVEGSTTLPLRCHLIGRYNASNLLAVIGALRALGVELAAAAAVVPALSPVPGRMQQVAASAADAPLVVVDYAHTPDALEQALRALHPLAQARSGRLWCVFGCGGNRDATKRPLMGAIAHQIADQVVLTSDNPRDETPSLILSQILAGIPDGDAVDVIEDRRAAIHEAVQRAAARDVVLLAGKGHEETQDVAGVKRAFSDVAVAALALAQRGGAAGSGRVMMTLAQAHSMVPAATLVGDGALAIERVHTDTRSLRAGDLFVALRGERFDGHGFLAQARQAGAAAAIAERGLAEAGLPGLLVGDSLRALQDLAAAWRRRFELPLIAVTGSNGKTTVTQMLAAILRAWCGDAALATAGNLNNHIGVPLTVLRLRRDEQLQHRAAVVELGMNHPGEIKGLARIAAPTVVLVNNAQREHLEFMASVEAVARENGSAIEALPASGAAVFPADDAQAAVWRAQAGSRSQLTFATRGSADVTASATWAGDHWALHARTPAGAADFSVHVAGAHNVHNALAAATAALAAGAPMAAIVQGLERFVPVSGRSRLLAWQRDGSRITLVDDSYNANPDSVRAAIDLLAGLPGPHWMVLGDMGEVGARGPEFHAEVGAYARDRGIAHLWAAGALCEHAAREFGANGRHFADTPQLIAALHEAPRCAAALIKGSRFMGMERVVRALVPQEAGHAH